MSATFDDVASGFATATLTSVKTNLGKVWDALTVDERDACERLMIKLTRARLVELAGKLTDDHLEILESAFLQWKAIASLETQAVVKAVLKDIASFGGTFASALLVGFVKRI